jgi:hypothetical protein
MPRASMMKPACLTTQDGTHGSSWPGLGLGLAGGAIRAPTRLRRGCENALMRSTERSSLQSIGSAGSILSIGSRGSVQSIGSPGSVQSVGSAGSILSIGSTGSILSIGSAGSILSIGSAGSILSIGSAGSVLSILSFGSAGSILSAFSRWSVRAWRGDRPRQGRSVDATPTPELAVPEEGQITA